MVVALIIIIFALLAWIIYLKWDVIYPLLMHSSSNSQSLKKFNKASLAEELNAVQAELKALRNDLSKVQRNQRNVIPQINDNFVQLGKRVTSLEKRINRAEKSHSNMRKEN